MIRAAFSLSRFPVGSSASSNGGSFARLRAMATRLTLSTGRGSRAGAATDWKVRRRRATRARVVVVRRLATAFRTSGSVRSRSPKGWAGDETSGRQTRRCAPEKPTGRRTDQRPSHETATGRHWAYRARQGCATALTCRSRWGPGSRRTRPRRSSRQPREVLPPPRGRTSGADREPQG